MNKLGRKFWAFVISLIAIVVCSIFDIDVSVGVSTLFGIYCMGNVGSKVANKNNNNMENNTNE